MKSSYYWKVSEILKHRKFAEVRRCLTQQLLAFFLNIYSLFLCQMQNYFLVVPKFRTSLVYNHSIHTQLHCSKWKVKNFLSKIINILTTSYLLRVSLLQRSSVKFFLYHLRNSSEACRVISSNTIRNHWYLKNE